MKVIDIPARDIPKQEFFDNKTQEFIIIEPRHIDPIHLQLEHSLMSISKWESKWHVPFLDEENLTGEKLLDYIRCMTINPQKNPDVYDDLTQEALMEIIAYMQDQHSAWVINAKKKGKGKKSKKADTVEAIYYAMIQYGIPPEYEKWHFNRLMALIDYCDSKGGSVSGAGGPQKKSQKEILEMYRAINEKNRKKYNSKG